MPPTIPLHCRRLHRDAELPRRTTPHGVDVHAYLKSENGHPVKMVLPHGVMRMVPTGLAVSGPTEPVHAVMLLPHINMSMRGVNVLNPLPVAPAKELTVALHNNGTGTEWIEHGDPIAQIVLVQLPTPVVMEDPL